MTAQCCCSELLSAMTSQLKMLPIIRGFPQRVCKASWGAGSSSSSSPKLPAEVQLRTASFFTHSSLQVQACISPHTPPSYLDPQWLQRARLCASAPASVSVDPPFAPHFIFRLGGLEHRQGLCPADLACSCYASSCYAPASLSTCPSHLQSCWAACGVPLQTRRMKREATMCWWLTALLFQC